MVEGQDVNISHRKYFIYYKILYKIVIYYACFCLITCFKVKEKLVKRLHFPVGLQAQLCYRAIETVLKLKIDMMALF